MNSHYNQNHSREEIDQILDRIQNCIRNGRYTISLNEHRQENIDFINEYNLSSKRQKEILLNINTEDFCHSLQNTKKGYEYETLYVFSKNISLLDIYGNKENVDIYTKFNIIKQNNGDFTVVISLHKLNKPIAFLFR